MATDSGANVAFKIDLPEVQMHVARPDQPIVGVVVRSELCTLGGKKSAGIVRHVEVDISGTPLAGTFRTGQAFGVVTPGVDEKGKPHKVRLYSIASPTCGEDGAGNIMATTVKRLHHELDEDHTLYQGVTSNYICDRQIGDELLITGPTGKRFLLPARPEEHEFLLIATGTGVAPFRGMVRELLGSVDRNVTLVMGSPYETDLLYHTDFLELEREYPNFTYVSAISRESVGGRPKEYVDRGVARIADSIRPGLLSGDTLVYVCGIAGMELGVLRTLATMLEDEPDSLANYIECDAKTLAEKESWDRRMIHRSVKPTRRVFLEVY